jgi:UDP-4-amino-4,6-dideoxy-N-acetyl-beta-L-altrosamine N-acetyltransferase
LVTLRDIRPEDCDMIREWRNLPRVSDYMLTDHVISPEEHAAWFARILKDPSCRYWIIVCDGEDVGQANIYNINLTHRRCYWGFYVVSPNVRGKGIGSYAEYRVLSYVFDELKLEKLCCETLASNRGVIEMHRRFFGFAEEGVFRKHIIKKGVFQDVVCQAILKEEWGAFRPRIEEWLRAKGLI